MAIEIVDFPIEHSDFPWQNVSSPEGTPIVMEPPKWLKFDPVRFTISTLGVKRFGTLPKRSSKQAPMAAWMHKMNDDERPSRRWATRLRCCLGGEFHRINLRPGHSEIQIFAPDFFFKQMFFLDVSNIKQPQTSTGWY